MTKVPCECPIMIFTPLESPAACSGGEDIIPFRANTLLETFSNGVYKKYTNDSSVTLLKFFDRNFYLTFCFVDGK